jgi:hypothetical protein
MKNLMIEKSRQVLVDNQFNNLNSNGETIEAAFGQALRTHEKS